MGLRGPKKQDGALNALKGNPGKRKGEAGGSTGDAIFVSLEKLPAPPIHMSAIGKTEWRRCGKELIRAGKLTSHNIKFFETYCESYADFREAKATLAVEGLTVRAKSGYPQQHPLVAIANTAQTKMAEAMKVIERADAKRPVEHSDPLLDFLARGQSIRRVK